MNRKGFAWICAGLGVVGFLIVILTLIGIHAQLKANGALVDPL